METFKAHCQIIDRDTLEAYPVDDGVWLRLKAFDRISEISLSRKDAKALRRYLKRALGEGA